MSSAQSWTHARGGSWASWAASQCRPRPPRSRCSMRCNLLPGVLGLTGLVLNILVLACIVKDSQQQSLHYLCCATPLLAASLIVECIVCLLFNWSVTGLERQQGRNKPRSWPAREAYRCIGGRRIQRPPQRQRWQPCPMGRAGPGTCRGLRAGSNGSKGQRILPEYKGGGHLARKAPSQAVKSTANAELLW